jgi:hypothetical protein
MADRATILARLPIPKVASVARLRGPGDGPPPGRRPAATEGIGHAGNRRQRPTDPVRAGVPPRPRKLAPTRNDRATASAVPSVDPLSTSTTGAG